MRDVGRSLDIPFADVDRVAKLDPRMLDMSLEQALTEVAARRSRRASRTARVKELIATAKRLEGMTRHAWARTSWLVIAPSRHTDFVPLQYKGRTTKSRPSGP